MDKFLTVDGIKTRYLEQGEGEPVFLIHGASLGSSAEVWEPNLRPLTAAGLRVLASDLPGYGLSDSPRDFSTAYQREHILRFMDGVGIDRASLVGHSMAGGIAFDLAFSRPDRIAAIVVLGTGSLVPPLPGGSARGAEAEVTSEPTLEETRADLEANTFDRTRITPQLIARRQELSIGKSFAAAQARRNARSERGGGTPAWQRLDQVPVPALFVYGKQDRASAGERAELARQRFPGINLHVLDNCKHMVQWDRADTFVDLAVNFLAPGSRLLAGSPQHTTG